MKEVVFFAILIILQASVVFSEMAQKGTIKSVDSKTGTLVFSPADGNDVTLKADKPIELDMIKAGDKAEISVENGMVKSMKPERVNWCPKDF
jgi:hypothetical protein